MNINTQTLMKNIDNTLSKKNIFIAIIRENFPIIKAINNVNLNNFFYIFHSNNKKTHLETVKKSEQTLNSEVTLNITKIKSLENESTKRSFEISSTVENLKDEKK